MAMTLDLSELSNGHLLPQTNLRAAFIQLYDSIDHKDKALYSSATFEEVLCKIRKLDEKHRSSDLTRKFACRLRPVLYNLQRYGQAFDALVQIQMTPTSVIWGIIRMIVEAAGSFVQYFDRLVTMIESLCDRFSLYRQYEQLMGRDSRFKSALISFYYHMLMFLLRAKKVFLASGLFWAKEEEGLKTLCRSVWRSFEIEFGDISEALARDSRNLDDEITLAWRIRVSRSLQLSDQEGQLLLENDPRPRDDLVSEHRKVLEWLMPADMDSVFFRESKRRIRASGLWLKSHTLFLEWLNSKHRGRLWINGFPGCGKTVLSTTFIEEVKLHFEADGKTATAFFFCSGCDDDTRSCLRIMATLIAQVLSRLDSVPPCILAAYTSASRSGRSRVSPADQLLCLLKRLASIIPLNIIIDGLDEADDPRALMKEMEDLQHAVPSVRIAYFSRDLPSIRQCLPHYSVIKVTPEQTKRDIDDFISLSVTELPIDDCHLTADIKHRLCFGANGMFLWANLMIQTLKLATTVCSIKQTMAGLPLGVEVTYQSILESLAKQSEERRELARTIFLWVCGARRPLSWKELEIAIVLSNIDGCDDAQDKSKMPFKRAVLELCAPLIEYSSDSDTFRVVHFSVFEFLRKNDNNLTTNERVQFFLVDRSKAEAEIAVACLRCLSDVDTASRAGVKSEKDPLVGYATMHWCTHLTTSQPTSHAWEETRRFLSCPTRRRAWIARFLFLHTTGFALQKLLNLQRKLSEWITSVTDSESFSRDTMDWIQDTTCILTPEFAEITSDSSILDQALRDMAKDISHFEILMVIRDLSREYTMSGRLDEGEAWLNRTLRHQRDMYGSRHPRITWILNGLGILYDQQKRTDLAIKTHFEALEIQEEHFGQHHLVPIWTVNELGRMFRHIGDYSSAEASHLRALAYLRLVLQPGDLQIAWTLNTLARTYRKQGKPRDAIRLHVEALEIQKSTLGREHPHVLWALADVASCRLDMHDVDAAVELHKEVLRSREKILGNIHADTTWSANALALALTQRGELTEARALHLRALETQIALIGEDSPDTVWTRTQVASLNSRSSISPSAT